MMYNITPIIIFIKILSLSYSNIGVNINIMLIKNVAIVISNIILILNKSPQFQYLLI